MVPPPYNIVYNLTVGQNDVINISPKYENYTYYIYLDSMTGKEVNILRVIDTNNGSLLM